MTAPSMCSRCGEEVRYGKRGDITGWLHREDVDHLPMFGRLWTPEDQARVELSLAEMAARGKVDKAKKEEVEEAEKWDEIPEPELPCEPVDIDVFAPRSGIRQIYNLAAKTKRWEVVNLTRCRGPYVGARGQVLSISDSVVMRMRGPSVDSGRRVAVASWRDGAFDFAYTGIFKGQTVTTQPANSMALKAWIKEIP